MLSSKTNSNYTHNNKKLHKPHWFRPRPVSFSFEETQIESVCLISDRFCSFAHPANELHYTHTHTQTRIQRKTFSESTSASNGAFRFVHVTVCRPLAGDKRPLREVRQKGAKAMQKKNQPYKSMWCFSVYVPVKWQTCTKSKRTLCSLRLQLS